MTTPAASSSIPTSSIRGGLSAANVQKGRLALPAEIVICPWGESFDLEGKPVIVNSTTLSVLAGEQSKHGFEEVALDFNHATVPHKDKDGNLVKPAEPLPIAATGRLSVEEGKGIIFHPLSWTPEGETYYTGRHYRDLSPTVARNEKGEVTFVHSVALTRNGQIRNLHAYSIAGLPDLTTLSTPLPNTTMENTAPDFRALALKLLKLDESATDEQIIAAAATAEVEPMSAEPTKKPDEEKPANVTPMSAAVTPDTTALSARLDKMERDNLVAEATRQGKIIPLSAETLNLTPLAVLTDLIAQLPAGAVPFKAGTEMKETPGFKALSAEEAVVAARLGYTAEQFRAANPA